MSHERTRIAGHLAANEAEPKVTPANPPGYELGDEIGRGGMGVVYLARDAAFDRDVAVKLLAACYPSDSPASQRFLNEARITGQLQHPGIPAVHQVGTCSDGRPFLAMKLIKGRTLDEVLKGRAEHGRLLAVFEAVCQAVGYAHAHRVIHRDLKPSNIMVGAFGEVQVMDWGLAKVLGNETIKTADPSVPDQTVVWTQISPTPETGSHTQAGSLVGTPAFIPPEQAGGEIERVDERADVFGLGALLAVILTGKAPYVGETAESVRLLAVRGNLDDCFARLDNCGAEPELIALCKRCLSFEPADRPRDGGEVAQAVAGLRSAAEERARTAERDKAAADARTEEQRRKRRWQFTAAAVVVVALVGGILGLSVYLRAQARANATLAEQKAKVEERFALAQRAIAKLHSGVSEDLLLKSDQFKELRTQLLKEAADFYGDLEKLLEREVDANSRKTLAEAYFELGELTRKIGSSVEALAVHRKALALRRELAAEQGADVETRLDVARSLEAEGWLLDDTGDPTGALRAFEDQRDIATALEAESATDAVRDVLARSHRLIGGVLAKSVRPAEALQSYQKSLAIHQKLAYANPTVDKFQSELAVIHDHIGIHMLSMGKPEAALTAWRKALDIQQELTNANPAVIRFQFRLAKIYDNIAWCLLNMGQPVQGAEADCKALDIMQKLVEDNPAVADCQDELANFQINIGRALDRQKRLAEAFTALDKGLFILQRLVKADPKNVFHRRALGESRAFRGGALVRAGQPGEAAADLRQALDLWAALPNLDIEIRVERARALALLAGLGGNAKSGVTKDEAGRFADQSVAVLADAVKAGWALPSELKEPDFDALRGRVDFQKLVADVESKTKKAEEKP
jgi:tetratricopeptide (TPR) repeat protein